MPPPLPMAPPLQISQWLNTDHALDLAALRGRVVLLHAFQMLCPGCVSYGLPQAERVRQHFAEDDLAVIGLHTVFEHHEVMNMAALRAFLQEYRWHFPIGIDAADPGAPIPRTMRTYGLRGTPSLVLIDRQGARRWQHFGQIDDLRLGALLGQVIAEDNDAIAQAPAQDQAQEEACGPAGCALPGSAVITPGTMQIS